MGWHDSISKPRVSKGVIVALFLATHINKLDKKGRVSVPAAWRASLTTAEFAGVVLSPSHKSPCLDGFPVARLNQLAAAMDDYAFYSDDQAALATTLFGSAHPLAFDADGRITLPDALTAHMKISDTIAFIGLGQFFQLWEPGALTAHQDTQRKRVQQHNLTLKLGG
jgi:MraZ protein